MLDLVHETNWKNWSKDSIKDKYYVNEEDASVFEWTVKYEKFPKIVEWFTKMWNAYETRVSTTLAWYTGLV